MPLYFTTCCLWFYEITLNIFMFVIFPLNTFVARLIQAVHAKTAGSQVALCGNFSCPVSAIDPVKGSKDSASLVVCTQKKFLVGVEDFCEWRCKWGAFRPPWPTSPGPKPKPLDGSISLKFLLETKLQSESFDTLDNVLGFRVQKLSFKVTKIFD